MEYKSKLVASIIFLSLILILLQFNKEIYSSESSNESMGNFNQTYLPRLHADTQAPELKIISPESKQEINRTAPEFIVEITENNLNYSWYLLEDNLTKHFFTENETINELAWQTVWDTKDYGEMISITFYANDSAGNTGSDFVIVKCNNSNSAFSTIYQSPKQPSNFTLTDGSSTFEGDLTFLNSNSSVFTSSVPNIRPNEYISDINYELGTLMIGDIDMTYEEDGGSMIFESEPHNLNPDLETVQLKLIFDPELNGRDFYLSIKFSSTAIYGTPTSVSLVNDPGYEMLVFGYQANSMYKIDMYVEDINYLTVHISSLGQGPFFMFFDYFKVKEVGETPSILNVTSSIPLNLDHPEEDLKKTSLIYSYTSNASNFLDFKIWNYDLNQWDLIRNPTLLFLTLYEFVLNESYLGLDYIIIINFYRYNLTEMTLLEVDMLSVGLRYLVLDAPDPPVLELILPNPDYCFLINLNWSKIYGATTYHIYRNTSLITSVSDLTPIATVSVNYSQDVISSYGTYYYIIVSENLAGNSTISNCESIKVTKPQNPPGIADDSSGDSSGDSSDDDDEGAAIPGYDLSIFIIVLSIISILVILKKRKIIEFIKK